jgi:hypothetical protein
MSQTYDHLASSIPKMSPPQVGVETSLTLWSPLQKKPLGNSVVQLCVVIHLVGARSITTHNCDATLLAGLLQLWDSCPLSWCGPL